MLSDRGDKKPAHRRTLSNREGMNPSVAVDNRVVEAVGGDSQAVREGRAAEGTTWTAEVGSLVARGNLGSLGADDSQPVAEGTPSAVHDLCEFAGLELEELGEQTCSCHPTCNSPVGRNGTEGLCLSCVAGWCPATAAAFQRGEQNGNGRTWTFCVTYSLG